jgi:bifunctional UDP-N-acetylglucosamine pyrophosphorylase/glucosamine-1-phosphate N-acetyltransferase
MQNVQAIVLAAGKSTRFKTGKTKLLEKICGQEMILYTTKLLETLHMPTTVVVGFSKEQVIETIETNLTHPVNFVIQEEQLGTGHAVRLTKSHWTADNILILNGDVPLITEELIKELYQKHHQSKAAISLVIAHDTDETNAYGRIVKEDGHIKIIEAVDFHGDANEHCCINAGIYLIRREFLEKHINDITQNNNKQAFYLTDLIKIASDNGSPIELISASSDQVRGVNTLKELWAAEQVKRAELISYWMSQGVRFSMAQTVHIDLSVSIGAGTEIGAGVQLRNGTIIGQDCFIGDFVTITKTILADSVSIHSHSVITDSKIENNASVGPFAHIREHAAIGSNSIIGNFVEIKKSIIGANTKAKHLSYLGDAYLGERVNIGAGTITCNHNGHSKQVTTIHDDAYIGVNNALVAPVTIGKGAFTAAGSTITNDVPTQALAIARARQLIKEGYAAKLRMKNKEKEIPSSADQTDELYPSAFRAAIKSPVKND